MVTMLCFLKRKPGMTEDAFHDHWRNRHGPLVAVTTEVARHVLRYEQYRPSAEATGFGSEGFDGVTVMVFESADALRAFISEPAYHAVIYPDEEAFLDRDALVWMVADEPTVVIDGPRP